MAKNKTYIAGDFDHDKDAINQIYAWKNSGRYSLDFHDAHELTQARDSSNNCSIKSSLKSRLDESKNFVLVVGTHTKTIRNGSCQYCSSYNSWTQFCALGHYVSYESYIEYECRQAVKDGKNIVVLYNATCIYKDRCPEILRNKGYHKEMKSYNMFSGHYEFDYNKVKEAFSHLG